MLVGHDRGEGLAVHHGGHCQGSGDVWDGQGQGLSGCA